MGVSWGALSGSFLAPFMYGLYWKKTTRAACAVTYAFGSILMIIQLCISLGWIAAPASGFLAFIFTNSLYSGVFSMVASLIIVPVVSLLTQGTRPVQTDDMFTCYDSVVTVHARTVLSDRDV